MPVTVEVELAETFVVDDSDITVEDAENLVRWRSELPDPVALASIKEWAVLRLCQRYQVLTDKADLIMKLSDAIKEVQFMADAPL